MVLEREEFIPLPPHASGGFDHADVIERTGTVYVAHTGAASLEVFDGVTSAHLKTIPGLPEASGVVAAQADGLVLATHRGGGKVLVIDARDNSVKREVAVGTRTNGIAWDHVHKRLLAADVGDGHVRVADPQTGKILAARLLPGRPRWCKYAECVDAWIVNIQDPSSLILLDPGTAEVIKTVTVSVPGAHGVDVNEAQAAAYISCDGGAVVAVDLETGQERWKVPIAGAPDVTWFNKKRGLVYCAIGRPGVIEVIDTVSRQITQRVATEERAGTFAFDQTRQRLYSFLPRSCGAAVYTEK